MTRRDSRGLALELADCRILGRVIYFGFLIEQGVCANDIWMCDHEFGYEIGETDYTEFFDFLTKVGLGIWDD
jgi:hypothetical protein